MEKIKLFIMMLKGLGMVLLSIVMIIPAIILDPILRLFNKKRGNNEKETN